MFNEILKDLKIQKEVALRQPEEGENDMNVLRNIECMSKAAVRKIADLRQQYKADVRTNVAFIIAAGENSPELLKVATEEFGCYDLNIDDFYNELIDAVDPRIYMNRSTQPAIFDLVSSKFEETALNLGVTSFPALIFSHKYQRMITERKELFDIVSSAFNECIGPEIIGLYAIEKLYDKMIEEEFAGKVVPIVLHSSQQSIVESLNKDLKRIFPNVFLVVAGKLEKTEDGNKNFQNKAIGVLKEVKKENVEEVLKKIKENLV